MGLRKTAFTPGEWYHCYTRTVDRGPSFRDASDYNRFSESLYLSNSTYAIVRGNLKRTPHNEIFDIERAQPIVSIGAYCAMPNHFHLLLRENEERGISTFMQRLGTSISMYYNNKYQHVGPLFIGPFRAKHIDTDSYAQTVAEYIHMNPAELFEHGWKRGVVKSRKDLVRSLSEYQYSSLPDYIGNTRPERSIVTLLETPFRMFDYERLAETLTDRQDYYASLVV